VKQRKPTATTLLRDIYKGYASLAEHPCSLCKAGLTFDKLPHFHGSDFGLCLREVQYKKIVNPPNDFDNQKTSFLRDGHTHEATIAQALRDSGHKVDHRDDAPDGVPGELDPILRSSVQSDEFIVVFYKERVLLSRAGGQTVGMEPAVLRWYTLRVNTIEELQEVLEMSAIPLIVMVGHTDGVIDDEILLECKAVKGWAWLNKFCMGKLPAKYVHQMHIYMYVLGLKAGALVVKHRETSEVQVHMVKPDPVYIEQRLDGFLHLLEETNKQRWTQCNPIDPDDKRWCKACKVLCQKGQ